MKLRLSLMVLAFIPLALFSQEETTTTDSLRKDALNVFMEASGYIKERIPYINYVRDRKVADLVIIYTREQTGAGGSKHTLFLNGAGKYSGMKDTLTYIALPDDTYDQIREKELKTLRMGLMRYILKTPLAEHIEIDFTEPISSTVSTDKWDSWVFTTDISGFSYGESSMKSANFWGGFEATRITEEWKHEFEIDLSYGMDSYLYEDVDYTSITNSQSVSYRGVKSLNDHWSVGGSTGARASTYSNYNFRTYFLPGVEYNIFPYSESTSRQLRILYTAGPSYNDYIDSTIFDKTEELLFSHSLSASYSIIKEWGSINTSVSWSNYLRDFSENELSLDGSLSWKVAKGLRVNVGGSYSFINNQVHLPKGELSAEDVLLEIQEMETDYSYFVHFGLSYTFGSIYNNVVNPRFGSGRGGRMIMF